MEAINGLKKTISYSFHLHKKQIIKIKTRRPFTHLIRRNWPTQKKREIFSYVSSKEKHEKSTINLNNIFDFLHIKKEMRILSSIVIYFLSSVVSWELSFGVKVIMESWIHVRSTQKKKNTCNINDSYMKTNTYFVRRPFNDWPTHLEKPTFKSIRSKHFF